MKFYFFTLCLSLIFSVYGDFSPDNYILLPKQNILENLQSNLLSLENYAHMFSLNLLSEFYVNNEYLPFYITTYGNLIEHYKPLSEIYDIEQDKVINIPNFNKEKQEYKVNYILPIKSDPVIPWHLDRIVKTNLPLNNTYKYNTKGSCHQNKNIDIHTYIVDTGIDISHSEFGGRAEWGANFVDDNNFDCHSHGTHVAGLVGSKNFGVCVDAKLYAVKVLDCRGSGSLSGVIKGIEWVYNQHIEKSNTSNKIVKSVINMSLGGGYSQALNRAVETCIKNNPNFYIIVAAGNENQDACKVSPAGATNILTVMASDKTDNRAWFSNWGQCANVYSPGVDIESTIPGNKSTIYSGTSMATPIMVGIFNHYLDMYPNKNMEDMMRLVDKLSTKNTIKGSKPQTKNNLVYLNRN